MTRKEKLKAIEAANQRIKGTGFNLSEVYPVGLRKLGYIAQILTVQPDPAPNTARSIIRRFDPDQLERLTPDNVRAAVLEGAQI